MRAFLIAFVCLSTLAMAQNVVVATPVPSDVPVSRDPGAGPERAGSLAFAPEARDAGAPRASTMMLLVGGLSGLCAVGSRRRDRSRPEQA